MLEIIGVACGIAGIVLTAKGNIFNFPVGIVNVLITAYIVFINGLYADVVQQFFYLIVLVIGWLSWNKSHQQEQQQFYHSTINERILYFVAIVILSACLSVLLYRFNPNAYLLLDAAGTAMAIIAQYMIARKKIENWYLWLIVNSLYTYLFFAKELYAYCGLSIIYFFLAIVGLLAWKKNTIQPFIN
ncbi:MAG: nicotinamide mononucleotide transporter [Bacteroidetes bacterium]|nr:nicotinamide mononucleotide transporter [Bacteroidota bacterium]